MGVFYIRGPHAEPIRRRAGGALVPGLAIVLWASTFCSAASEKLSSVSFVRDIRPILLDHCYACHGPDAEHLQADLRLDTRQSLFAARESGSVISPGRPDQSVLLSRITDPDEARRMPPADAGPRLPPDQVALVRRWVEQQAPWETHWAFSARRQPQPAHVRDRRWARSVLDTFVLSQLQERDMVPSPEADRRTLIRRVSLDLTGLPPTPGQVAAFLADTSPASYHRLVDRLLASPRYGERMAAVWLDAARYADTYGYQDDGERAMWRWRDWVIDAFNANMPFDRFTTEQLAGDLLPNASFDQHLATGFHRNHRANSEGGAIAEEFRVESVADRVDTTATVWLGMTMICSRCHDHKYDPIRQEEFYQFFAFFNNVPEDGRARKHGNTPPLMVAPTRAQRTRLRQIEEQIEALHGLFQQQQDAIHRAQTTWENNSAENNSAGPLPEAHIVARALEAHFPLDGNAVDTKNENCGATFVDGEPSFGGGRVLQSARFDGRRFISAGDVADFGDDDKFTLAAWIRPHQNCSGSILSRMEDVPRGEGYNWLARDGHVRLHLVEQWLDDAIRVQTRRALSPNRWTHVAVSYDGSQLAQGIRIYFDGVLQDMDVEIDSLFQSFGTNEPLRIGAGGGSRGRFRGALDDIRVYGDVLSSLEVGLLAVPESLTEILGRPASDRTPWQACKLQHYYLQHHPPPVIADLLQRIEMFTRRRKKLEQQLPTVMVMKQRDPPRPTYVLQRGQYDAPGKQVAADVPRIFPPLPPGAPRNRLGLARWLVHPGHPLTSRVAVNRWWQMSFGTGLVRTAEDFGTRGELPSHPRLLDWLARELIRSGWNIKALRRRIVTCAVYRQSSRFTPDLRSRDPANRLLARGPRFRLPAEMIRDQALLFGGLLCERLGGPSVKPYQPAGLWHELSAHNYEQDHGSRLYRRSLYTFWKRTVIPPTMAAFDAADRETCAVRESRTNTPLQALTLMNGTCFVEAARAFAQRVLLRPGLTTVERLEASFQRIVGRPPTGSEVQVLGDMYREQLEIFRRRPEAAAALTQVGELPRNRELDIVELAALTAVSSTLLNLDEVVTQH